MSSRANLIFAMALCVVLTACGPTIVRKAEYGSAEAGTPGYVLAHGRINYVVDGEIKTPYSAFRPAWQAPFVNAVQLESGNVFAFPAVDNKTGAFAWEVPPGSYVITRIGVGTITDNFGTFIAWPRVAFRIPPGARKVYLGHLVLAGTSYVEKYKLSTGTEGVSKGVRYEFRVVDELSDEGEQRSLMFHDPNMPIGVGLQDEWNKSKPGLIDRIFAR